MSIIFNRFWTILVLQIHSLETHLYSGSFKDKGENFTSMFAISSFFSTYDIAFYWAIRSYLKFKGPLIWFKTGYYWLNIYGSRFIRLL